MKRLTSIFAATMLMLLSTSVAFAEVVQEWTYTSDAIFVSWTDENGRTGNAANNPSSVQGVNPKRTLSYDVLNGSYAPGSQSGYSSLRWGSNNTYSSIGMTSNSGKLITDGANTGSGVSLWHNNKAINSTDVTIQSGTALLTLDLAPVGATIAELGTFGIELDFYFIETANASSGSTARDPDIFIVTDPFKFASQQFEYDGVDYWFTFEASFNPLTGWFLEQAQRLLGTTDTLYGWTTSEGQTTNFTTEFAVLYEKRPVNTPTPEPGTVLLMGVGLLGMLGMRKRFKK